MAQENLKTEEKFRGQSGMGSRIVAAYLRRKYLSRAIQAAGAAVGSVAGPLGRAVGSSVGKFFVGMAAAAAFVVFFFLGCAIQSWCPVIFNNVTLINSAARSGEMTAIMSGYGSSAADLSELQKAFEKVGAGLKQKAETLSEAEQTAFEACVLEPWDTAYLCAAYAVSTELYAGGEGDLAQDLTLKVFTFLKNAALGYEVEISRQEIEPAVYPIFEAQELLCVKEDGEIFKTKIYEKTGEAETTEVREEPAYREIEVQPAAADQEGEVKMPEKLKCYERVSGQTTVYAPEIKTVREKKYIRGALKKSTVLVSLGLMPEEIYVGEAPFAKVTNAEYTEYLRKSLIQTLGAVGTETARGKYIWPCPGYTEITSWFGPRPASDTGGIGTTNHGGIDVGAPAGAEIVAAAAGTVVQAGGNGGYGNSVEIDHGGTTTLYAHMSAIAVAAGDQVAQGQVIGWVGATGNATGPHLHLSAYEDGKAIDPMLLFTKAQHPYGLAPEDFCGAAGDVESWRQAAEAALAANGLSTEKWMVDKVLRQIATESGGDAQSVQRIADINSGTPIPFNGGICPWCAGKSAGCGNANVGHGLMQTIPSTFETYCHQGHENIFDGYDNLLAALCYAKARYGPQLMGIGDGHGY